MARAGVFRWGVLAVLLGVIVAVPARAGQLFTVRQGDDVLRVIDTVTLEITTVGPLGVPFAFGGLAWDAATETMYMVTGLEDRILYAVDPNTGTASVVGHHGVEALFGVAFDPASSRLFASQSTLDTGVYRIDPVTLDVEFVGDPGVDLDGLTYDAARDTLVGASSGAGNFYAVDRADASVELLFKGPFFNNAGVAHDFQRDLYWLIDTSGDLVTYDPSNGFERTVVLSGLGAHDGLVFLANPTPIVFEPPVRVADVPDPTAVATADFTASSGNDIAVPARAVPPGAGLAGDLLLLLNDGSGVNYDEVLTGVGVAPSDVAVGDFDGVNGPDAAVTNAGDDTVTILLNDGLGLGTFAPDPQTVVVGANPIAIEAGFINGDEALDLVVANRLDDTITILTNDGAGVFTAGAPIPVGRAPRGIGIADLGLGASSSEQAQDLAVTNQDDDTVMLLTNDGQGGFEEMVEIPVGAGPGETPPEDLDNDKDIDLAIQNDGGAGFGGEPSGVTILLNEGGGVFTRIDLPVGGRASSVDVEDLDSDGDQDLLVVAQQALTRTVTVLRSNLIDTGVFSFTEVLDLAPNPALELVATDRMNGDQTPDVIVVNFRLDREDGSVEVLLNRTGCQGDFNDDGIIGFDDLLALLAAWGPCEECPEDIDGSGEVDFADLLLLLSTWGPCAGG